MSYLLLDLCLLSHSLYFFPFHFPKLEKYSELTLVSFGGIHICGWQTLCILVSWHLQVKEEGASSWFYIGYMGVLLRILYTSYVTISKHEITIQILLPDQWQISMDWQVEVGLQQMGQWRTKTDISMCLPRHWWHLEDSFLRGKILFCLQKVRWWVTPYMCLD